MRFNDQIGVYLVGCCAAYFIWNYNNVLITC